MLRRKGSVVAEYALVLGAVVLVSAATLSIFGSKVNDMVASTTAIIPGVHAQDIAPVYSAELIPTTVETINGQEVKVIDIERMQVEGVSQAVVPVLEEGKQQVPFSSLVIERQVQPVR